MDTYFYVFPFFSYALLLVVQFRILLLLLYRKLRFFSDSLKRGSVLSMLDNNTKTRTALTLPTDHTDSLVIGLVSTKEVKAFNTIHTLQIS